MRDIVPKIKIECTLGMSPEVVLWPPHEHRHVHSHTNFNTHTHKKLVLVTITEHFLLVNRKCGQDTGMLTYNINIGTGKDGSMDI